MRCRILCLITLILSFFSPFGHIGSADPMAAKAPSSKQALTFSLVPKKNVDQQIHELRPLFDLLEKELQRPIHIIRPSSYHSVIEGILSQTIDFAILGPAAYARAKARDVGVEAFAAFAREKGTFTPQGCHYHSLLFTLKKNDFQRIEDLMGSKVALTDPSSTSGSVIPDMAFSKEIGSPMKRFFGSHIYTGSHDRSIYAVIRHQADAAFVSSARLDEIIKKGILRKNEIQILWQSTPIYRDPFVFSSGVAPDLRSTIRQIFLSSASALRDMLDTMNLIDIVEVNDGDYQAIHDIIATQASTR